MPDRYRDIFGRPIAGEHEPACITCGALLSTVEFRGQSVLDTVLGREIVPLVTHPRPFCPEWRDANG